MTVAQAIQFAIDGLPVELRNDPDMRTGTIVRFNRAPFAVVEWNDGTSEILDLRDLQDGRLLAEQVS
jgi:hypothetical protein